MPFDANSRRAIRLRRRFASLLGLFALMLAILPCAQATAMPAHATMATCSVCCTQPLITTASACCVAHPQPAAKQASYESPSLTSATLEVLPFDIVVSNKPLNTPQQPSPPPLLHPILRI